MATTVSSSRLLSTEWKTKRGVSPLSSDSEEDDNYHNGMDEDNQRNTLMEHRNSNMRTIHTQYEPPHKKNKFNLRGCTQEQLWEKTEIERSRAKAALRPKNWDDLEMAVSTLMYIWPKFLLDAGNWSTTQWLQIIG